MSVRYPKRKRAVIKYTEPDDEIEGLDDLDEDAAKSADDADDADATDGEGPRKKVCKSRPLMTPVTNSVQTKTKRTPHKKADPPRPKPFPFM